MRNRVEPQELWRRGIQGAYSYVSASTGTPMTFSVFVPEHAPGTKLPELLVSQGTADNFLDDQRKPHLPQAVCARAGIPATIRMHEGYGHSYFFISTFMAEHVAWHAARL